MTNINSPEYYKKSIDLECIEFSQLFTTLPAHAFEYVWRAGLKNTDPKDDLNKAKWYLNKALDNKVRLYDESALDDSFYTSKMICHLMSRITDWRGPILYFIADGDAQGAINKINEVLQNF